jgi:hypothetical protein
MSGLVRRLAQQARGNAHDRTTTVRSAALVHPRAQLAGISVPTPTLQFPAQRATAPAQHAATASNSSAAHRVEQAHSADNSRGQRTAVEPAEAVSAPATLLERNVAKGDAGVLVDPFASRPVAERRFPEPLLHEHGRDVTRVSPLAPTALPPLRASSAERHVNNEPTEVHVHIGRIEVMAVNDATKPKSETAATRRTTRPLADYLKRGSRA